MKQQRKYWCVKVACALNAEAFNVLNGSSIKVMQLPFLKKHTESVTAPLRPCAPAPTPHESGFMHIIKPEGTPNWTHYNDWNAVDFFFFQFRCVSSALYYFTYMHRTYYTSLGVEIIRFQPNGRQRHACSMANVSQVLLNEQNNSERIFVKFEWDHVCVNCAVWSTVTTTL